MRPGVRLLVRLAWIVAALVAAVVLVLLLLTTGTAVECAEAEGPGRPELRCDFIIARPAAEVWEAFARTDTPQPHYFDAVLQADMRPGGRWRFVTDDRKRLLAGGEILELQPPQRLAALSPNHKPPAGAACWGLCQ